MLIPPPVFQFNHSPSQLKEKLPGCSMCSHFSPNFLIFMPVLHICPQNSMSFSLLISTNSLFNFLFFTFPPTIILCTSATSFCFLLLDVFLRVLPFRWIYLFYFSWLLPLLLTLLPTINLSPASLRSLPNHGSFDLTSGSCLDPVCSYWPHCLFGILDHPSLQQWEFLMLRGNPQSFVFTPGFPDMTRGKKTWNQENGPQAKFR